ncbi:MAG: DNA-binding protein [Elusimicrobia bacterium GWA2_56_46]|nr:MAG: DNA-binding protein [Elusimicrobia bacterium GWA2_56_46]OGR55029.1 MAG: DNA-binding protein [Elusimicrobia bacterium GWC2_56_31]HBB67216.1 DNA-binding protein [Elusimicrobiota bacterium]HBW23956.1 DNA-binding protein [Elusimicrobiota bacterium]
MKHLIPLEVIESKILLIRGHKVMLDRDLARLYDVETRVLNQAVKRNIDHFSDDFIIVLTRDEIRRISQFVISSDLKFSKSVMAFTEEGVAMLSGILRSQRAIQVNIAIMRTFVKLRRLMNSHADLARKLEELEKKYDSQFKSVFDAIKMLMAPAADSGPKKTIGFRPEK